MKKVILLSRVSTERQDFTAQTKEMVDYILKDGYSREQIIIIEDKESAIKLSEEERQGITKMKESIQSNPDKIEALYIWELSRLSRVPVILYSVRDLLLSKKINLIVKTPSIRLLDDNKNIIGTSMIVLSLFIALVENEMREKTVRFERGKRESAFLNKYTGGYIKYGYCVDDNKDYQINENEAFIIKLIFDLYETGKYSHRTIVDELKTLGYSSDIANIGKIQNVLKSIEYTGAKPTDKRLNVAYPAIITEEQFNACKALRTINNVKLNKSTDIYYSHLLLTCQCCNKRLQPKISSHLYKCPDRSALTKYSSKPSIEKCLSPQYLNMELVDSFMWYVAKEKETNSILSSTRQQIDNNIQKIDELNIKLSSTLVRFDEIKQKRNRLGLSFVEGLIDKDVKDKKIKEFTEQEAAIEQDRLKYTNEIERLQVLNNNIQMNISKKDSINLTQDEKFRQEVGRLTKQSYFELLISLELESITEHSTRYDIIRKHIANVMVSSIDNNNKSLTVEFINPELPNEVYTYRKDGKQVKPVILKGKKVIEIPIVKQYKASPSLGQYDKIKAKGEVNQEYTIRMQMYKRYHSSVYRLNKNEYLSIEEKQTRLAGLKEKYKQYI